MLIRMKLAQPPMQRSQRAEIALQTTFRDLQRKTSRKLHRKRKQRTGKLSSVARLMSVPMPVDTEPSGVLPGSNRCRLGPLPRRAPCS